MGGPRQATSCLCFCVICELGTQLSLPLSVCCLQMMHGQCLAQAWSITDIYYYNLMVPTSPCLGSLPRSPTMFLA